MAKKQKGFFQKAKTFLVTVAFVGVLFVIVSLALGLHETLKSEPQPQSQSGPSVEQAEPQSNQQSGSQSGQSGDTTEEIEVVEISPEEKSWQEQHDLLAEQLAEAEGYMAEANAMGADGYYFRSTAEEVMAKAHALLEEEPDPNWSKSEWKRATRQIRDMKVEVRHHGAQAKGAIKLGQ